MIYLNYNMQTKRKTMFQNLLVEHKVQYAQTMHTAGWPRTGENNIPGDPQDA